MSIDTIHTTEYIRRCYQQLLGRDPDPQGLATYGEALAAGRITSVGLATAIVQSEEFRLRVDARQWPSPPPPTSPFLKYAPPGHFYSPIPSAGDLNREPLPIVAEGGPITISLASQLEMLAVLQPYYDTLTLPRDKTPGRRYHLDNPAYSYYDAIILHCLLRHLAPRRVVEVGSGYSSAAMLDTADKHLDGRTTFTFIEPSPATVLDGLLRADDRDRHAVVASEVQRVPDDVFDVLQANDLLFIDSSHVAKYGSDVCQLFFRVLPRLRPGVVVHVHDIFANFDYPREWLLEGRAWSEAYLLRAWLSHNASWEILLFNDWLFARAQDWLAAHMPLCLVQPTGSPFANAGVSLWLRRRA